MKLVITLETRFAEFGGELYACHMPYESFWQRYLEFFSEVLVVARARAVASVAPNMLRATGPRVRYRALAYYEGPFQYLTRRKENRRILREIAAEHRAFLLRVPGPSGSTLAKMLWRKGQPFAVEIVGDPWDSIGAALVPQPIKTWLRWRGYMDLRRVTRQAAAALYVTQHALQRRYPPAPAVMSVGISDVLVPPERLVEEEPRLASLASVPQRLRDLSAKPVRVGFLGAFSPYKDPMLHIQAAERCIRGGMNIQLHFAGSGHLEASCREYVQQQGLADRVIFHGRLSAGDEVFSFLRSLDLYLLVSRQEGLPRALVEALACGCPAIASNVGGVSELLPPDMLVRPGIVEQTAQRMGSLLADGTRLAQASRENLAKAREYFSPELEKRRRVFYRHLAELFHAGGRE